HLLEMRDAPVAIGAVAAESTAELIVKPASSHFFKRMGNELPRIFITIDDETPQAECQFSWVQKFWGIAKPARSAVIQVVQVCPCLLDWLTGMGKRSILSRQSPGKQFQQGATLLFDV